MKQLWTSWVVGSTLVGANLGAWAGSGAIASAALTITSVALMSADASAAVLSGWTFNVSRNQLSITLPQTVTPRFLVFAEPARIVLEVPDTQLESLPTAQNYEGAVRRVEVLRPSADTVHIVLELAPGTVIDRRHAELTSAPAGSQTRWTLTPLIVGTAPIASQPAPVLEPEPAISEAPASPVAEPTDLPPVSIAVEPAPGPAATEVSPAPNDSPAPTEGLPEVLPEVLSEVSPVAPAESPVTTLPSALEPTPSNVAEPTDLPPVSIAVKPAPGPAATASEVSPAPNTSPALVEELPEDLPEVLPEVSPVAPAESPAATLPAVPGPAPSTAPVPDSAAQAQTATPESTLQTPTLPTTATPAGPRFIQTPDGQLSIRASNLMLPPSSSLATLPNTLPLDPFEPSFAPATQVTVPPLDSTVAITPNAPMVNVPSPESLTVDPPAAATPSPGAAVAGPTASGPAVVAEPPLAAEVPAVEPSAVESGAVEPGAIAINPPSAPPAVAPSAPVSGPNRPIEVEPVAAAPATVVSPAVINAPPPAAVSVPAPEVAAAIAPTAPAVSAAPASPVPVSPAPASPVPNALVQEPPFLTAPVPAVPAVAPAIAVLPPTAPTVSRSGALAAEPVPFLAAAPQAAPTAPASGAPIAFGEPLPAAKEDVPQFPYLAPPAAGESPYGPDVLIPQGTLLQLRYPGAQPLQLDQNAAAQTPLLLAADLYDAKTGALIAPAGSQVVGQFAPDELGLRWTSQALLLPGQQVSLASASAYLSGPPQVEGQSLALNSGIGALALTVLTGFSGVGLIGGALMGATAAVATAPQTIVVEPNQIIEVQVLEAVPRAIFHVGG